MLSLERIRMLHSIARHGSVGGAAEALYVTTAAVSQQMAKLEREVGQPLLARHGRGVRLTDAGELLARHADSILSSVEQAEAALAAHLGQVSGELVIAAFPTAARGLLPATLIALRKRHPQLRPRLQEAIAESVVPALRRGDIDVAIVLDWDNRPMAMPDDMQTVPLLDDPADLIVPAGHRLADRDLVDLSELGEDDWITSPSNEMCQEWLMNTLRSKGIEPRIVHTAGEHQTQLTLVAAGFGVAVVPRMGRHPEPEGVAVVAVRDVLQRHIYAMWRADSDRRPSIQATVQALQYACATTTP